MIAILNILQAFFVLHSCNSGRKKCEEKKTILTIFEVVETGWRAFTSFMVSKQIEGDEGKLNSIEIQNDQT